ncbi:MAG TPA: 3D domain-containing protein [Pyrinomonadaceae bacterium]|nr:3D domain-containing protein [Pyrinomonadaceae bacterium]
MKAIVSRSAVVAGTLLIGLIAFSATPSIADTPFSRSLSQKEVTLDPSGVTGKVGSEDSARVVAPNLVTADPAGPTGPFVATAYSLRGRTASGRMVTRGLIAADPRVLPLGTRVRLDHPGYTGEYLVADTGGAIRGRRIDIWTPSTGEAMRFGRRTVKLTVLSYGGRKVRRIAKG